LWIVLVAMWKTVGVSSPAIRYMFGIFNKSPWELVKVQVMDPAAIHPCSAPAAPASDYIIYDSTTYPKIFFLR